MVPAVVFNPLAVLVLPAMSTRSLDGRVAIRMPARRPSGPTGAVDWAGPLGGRASSPAICCQFAPPRRVARTKWRARTPALQGRKTFSAV